MERHICLALLLLVRAAGLSLNWDETWMETNPMVDLLQQVADPEPELSPGLHDTRSTPATVQIYVMNLAKRTDRWTCAKNQLKDSPYKWSRIEATTDHDLRGYSQCAHLTEHRPSQALMCTNFRIWEQEVVNGTADYVIILEDDFVLGPNVWEKIGDLVNGPCRDSFDYLVADTFHGVAADRKLLKKNGEGFCKNASPGVNLFAIEGSGAQMQIIKRSALPTMMELVKENPTKPMDRVNKENFHEKLRTGMFQASIAAQFRSSALVGVKDRRSLGCESSVGQKTDIKRGD